MDFFSLSFLLSPSLLCAHFFGGEGYGDTPRVHHYDNRVLNREGQNKVAKGISFRKEAGLAAGEPPLARWLPQPFVSAGPSALLCILY